MLSTIIISSRVRPWSKSDQNNVFSTKPFDFEVVYEYNNKTDLIVISLKKKKKKP